MGLAGLTWWLSNHKSLADAEETSGTLETLEYISKETGFSIRYPASFKLANKLLKTHKDEVFFKSGRFKKYNFGVTVDPVTIKSLNEFGSKESVGDQILKLERGKEGVLFAEMRSIDARNVDGLECYAFDYVANSTRGNIHYLSNLVIDRAQNLHTLTVQSKQEDFELVKDEMNEILSSFHIPSSPSFQ